ncbi:hypothetical protein K488DRAFT_40102 [Vararia minispora EC-137]|uniref:Uncharacterized protein n=1 Tax=Vararia minispora EC-137 TaxID=1314806 RepID=A0ACB8QZT2_9AGAM|nr:hypothetical protein K488DRAFT_40102 [Vararia minispora EC-137]
MAEKQGAHTQNASDTDFRRKWDKAEYAEKARKKDEESRELAKENEERLKQGKKPLKSRKKDVPKPTELMKRREDDLALDKNLGKTMVVNNPGGRGPGQPGFYCEACNKNYKDTTAYLDHINGRSHLRNLGQTTRIERSTVEQVRARIALLREKTKQASASKAFDFDQRLREIRDKEAAARAAKKAERMAAKEKTRIELAKSTPMDVDSENVMAAMGFVGFGTSKK